MPNLEAFKETEGKKQEHRGESYMKQHNRSMEHAERKTCNEKADIRNKTISGDPFVSSARKQIDKEIKASEKPSVSTDVQLHADTTDVGDNVVSGMKKGGWTESSEKQLKMQKDKKVDDAVKRKVFQN